MSARGRKFLDDWVAGHLVVAPAGDPIAASDLADQMMKAAVATCIRPDEISEETGSPFEFVLEAMRNRNG